MLNLNRRVVCAANRYGDLILLGPRHWDTTMRKNYDDSKEVCRVLPNFHEFEQGFINTWGEFLTREQAWLVACHNKQIIQYVGNQGPGDFAVSGVELYSENLY